MSFAPTAPDPARRRLTLLAMCIGQGMTGYGMALTVAGSLLLVDAVIAFVTLRPRAMRASTATR